MAFGLLLVLTSLAPKISEAQSPIARVAKDTVLNASQKIEAKAALKGKIVPGLVPTKNDYVDENNRGTVDFDPTMKINLVGREVLSNGNYSKHKVNFKDGQTIKGGNFSQSNPDTVISAAKNLTFIESNLTNVLVDDTWTLIECINPQVRFSIIEEGGKTYEIQEIRKNGIWSENQRIDISAVIPE